MLIGCAGGERPDPSPDAALADDRCPSDLPGDMDCATAAPSYSGQTGAIIEQRCTVCHFEGNTQSRQVFASYDDVFAEKRGMLTQIYACRMPPSEAVELPSSERKALLKWLVCGAPDN